MASIKDLSSATEERPYSLTGCDFAYTYSIDPSRLNSEWVATMTDLDSHARGIAPRGKVQQSRGKAMGTVSGNIPVPEAAAGMPYSTLLDALGHFTGDLSPKEDKDGMFSYNKGDMLGRLKTLNQELQKNEEGKKCALAESELDNLAAACIYAGISLYADSNVHPKVETRAMLTEGQNKNPKNRRPSIRFVIAVGLR